LTTAQKAPDLSRLKCLRCNNSLRRAGFTMHTIICGHCGTSYPLIGRLPVLFSQPEEALAATYVSYIRFETEQQRLISDLDRQMKASRQRSHLAGRIKEALARNLSIIDTVRLALEPLVSVRSVASVSSRNVLAYSTSLNYLRRDWCRPPECEHEIRIIKETLATVLNNSVQNRELAVYMGAGMGRIAWEFSSVFRQSVAIDNSIAMGFNFYRLQQEPIPFYEINTKRVFQTDDMIRPLEARMPHAGPDDSEILYIAASALDTPLQDASASSVVSVYFTDVFPLRLYLKEVKRILKPGGLFVHFGPLEYHFEETADMLSAEDIRIIFETEGFDTLKDEEVHTTNLESAVSMLSVQYRNWFFAARLRTNSPTGHLLTLHPDVTYVKKAPVYPREEEEELYIIDPNGQKHLISAPVLVMLRLIDGKSTREELIRKFRQEYNTDAVQESRIRSVLDTFAAVGIITTIAPPL